jgi:hypothetical protein
MTAKPPHEAVPGAVEACRRCSSARAMHLLMEIPWHFEHLHPPRRQRVQAACAAVGLAPAGMIDADLLPGFHALPGRGDDPVGTVDDVGGGAVVLHQGKRRAW